MNKQEMFETAILGVWDQKDYSGNKDGFYIECSYRGSKGTKCAIGHLISDEDYEREFEGQSIDYLITEDLVDFTESEFLRDIQSTCHDRPFIREVPFKDLPKIWKSFAESYGLKMPECLKQYV